MMPSLAVKDIELIKKIVTKDFEFFTDHNVFIKEEYDPLFGRNLFSLKGNCVCCAVPNYGNAD